MINKKLLLLTLVATGYLQSMERATLPPLKARLAALKAKKIHPTMLARYNRRGLVFRFDTTLYATFLPDDALLTIIKNDPAFISHAIHLKDAYLRDHSDLLVGMRLLTKDEVPVALARVVRLERRIDGLARFEETDGTEWFDETDDTGCTVQ